jgi:hypothetical protein
MQTRLKGLGQALQQRLVLERRERQLGQQTVRQPRSQRKSSLRSWSGILELEQRHRLDDPDPRFRVYQVLDRSIGVVVRSLHSSLDQVFVESHFGHACNSRLEGGTGDYAISRHSFTSARADSGMGRDRCGHTE